jgi:hypothetical protein
VLGHWASVREWSVLVCVCVGDMQACETTSVSKSAPMSDIEQCFV